MLKVTPPPPSDAQSLAPESLTLKRSCSVDVLRLDPYRRGLIDSPKMSSSPSSVSSFDPPSSTEPIEGDITCSAVFDHASFLKWITCICVVEFDLELGQVMEHIYPPKPGLSVQDLNAICFHAFPDSNQSCHGNMQFSFRFPTSDPQDSIRHYNGTVLFRQIPDKNNRRGFFQKSVVVVTPLLYPTFFSSVVKIIADNFFRLGASVLQTACSDISFWPTPCLNTPLDLSLLQTSIKVILSRPVGPSDEEPSKESSVLVGTLYHHAGLYESLFPLLDSVEHMWEIMLVSEPLVVMSSFPSVTSDVVFALMSLITPIPYCADFRPFYTIHNADFSLFSKKSEKLPHAVLGLTNPHFLEAFDHWPHFARLSSSLSAPLPAQKPVVLKRMSSSLISTQEGFHSISKPYLASDKTFMKKLLLPDDSNSPSQLSGLIREHFFNLTQQFLFVIERYLTKLMPLKKSFSPFKAIPTLAPFIAKEFLSLLPEYLPGLAKMHKGDWMSLYAKFLKSPNFVVWLQSRQSAVNKELVRQHLTGVLHADVEAWVASQTCHIEIVDFLITWRDALRFAIRKKLFSEEQVHEHRVKMAAVMEHLPVALQHASALRDFAPPSWSPVGAY